MFPLGESFSLENEKECPSDPALAMAKYRLPGGDKHQGEIHSKRGRCEGYVIVTCRCDVCLRYCVVFVILTRQHM